ncbi:hypothetical protein ACHAQA_002586 [Verticillium albo-atrum]
MPTTLNADEERVFDEHAPLLDHGQRDDAVAPDRKVLDKTSGRLYLSHFLSTWNSRVFEFGAVLYLAKCFPGTLMPMSIYAFVRGLAAIMFAPAVGQYIDVSNRLRVVRISIMEKDWVVVVAAGDQEALLRMNSQMRRIDLFCKLLGPLFIALLDSSSVQAALLVNFVMSVTSVMVEYYAIARVYFDVPALQETKQTPTPEMSNPELFRESESRYVHCRKYIKDMAKQSVADFGLYFHHRAFLPSIAGALLYLTVLSFAGQMVTYLLATGFYAAIITVARTLGVAIEVLATWVAPWLMGRIGPVRAGLWMSTWQVTMLVAGIAVFWRFQVDRPFVSTLGLVGGTILSRLGLRGFDMCTQIIVQEDVEPESRGVFSTVEAAWQNAFELLSYVATIVFSRPDQFKWPSLISVVAVASASAIYTVFVYRKRGHLLHLDALAGLLGNRKAKERERGRALGRITARPEM